ncbi:MAG: DUF5629 family protein [Pseudomonas sp.]|uniref:DUF5629 family protein n=1 Tax=Pseudomonas sp. TaxID=306 RepID=UPI003BB50861
MTGSPNSLLEALQSADMLLINDLHAWQFSFEPGALALAQAAADSELPLLKVECMDGRTRRVWTFSVAAVLAAQLDQPSQCWTLHDGNGEQRIHCLDAICASNDDEGEEQTEPAV